MSDTYEVCFYLWTDERRYSVEHRFPSLPETETVKALLDEARRSFVSLYEHEADALTVDVVHLSASERTEDVEVASKVE